MTTMVVTHEIGFGPQRGGPGGVHGRRRRGRGGYPAQVIDDPQHPRTRQFLYARSTTAEVSGCRPGRARAPGSGQDLRPGPRRPAGAGRDVGHPRRRAAEPSLSSSMVPRPPRVEASNLPSLTISSIEHELDSGFAEGAGPERRGVHRRSSPWAAARSRTHCREIVPPGLRAGIGGGGEEQPGAHRRDPEELTWRRGRLSSAMSRYCRAAGHRSASPIGCTVYNDAAPRRPSLPARTAAGRHVVSSRAWPLPACLELLPWLWSHCRPHRPT